MHEMSLVMGMLREVERQLEPYGPGVRVLKLGLRVGRLHAVVPEAMRLCFEVASQSTIAEGARLEIEQLDVVGRCPSCGREWQLTEPLFLCPSCETPVAVAQGEELTLATIEFETPDTKEESA
ncbi:MAG: hydrogenase maturation nickel metallochaperone HypA [Thermoleophilia bacterium]